MYSLSTSWNSCLHSKARNMVEEIRALGFEHIELGFALSRSMVEETLKFKEEGLIMVSSLHNVCPIPDGIPVAEASPDYYSLSSSDEEERALAVEGARRTIAYAEWFGAKAVILHTGKIPVKDRMRELAKALEAGDKDRYDTIRHEMEEERKRHGDGYLENVIRSLKELLPSAKASGVKIGIENRYSYRDIPLADEFEYIFKQVEDVWYWHDTGHAEVFDRLGLSGHKELLERCSGRLIGVHLHDIIGYLNDHQAPLCGTFEFGMLAPYIRADTIKVIEAHQPATKNQIKRALAYLEKTLGD